MGRGVARGRRGVREKGEEGWGWGIEEEEKRGWDGRRQEERLDGKEGGGIG